MAIDCCQLLAAKDTGMIAGLVLVGPRTLAESNHVLTCISIHNVCNRTVEPDLNIIISADSGPRARNRDCGHVN